MMALRYVLATSALALCCLANAGAATVCVTNKQTGQLEPLVAGTGNARDCAAKADALPPAAPVVAPVSAPGQVVLAGAAHGGPAPEQAGRNPAARPAYPKPARPGAEVRRDWTLRTDYHTLEEAIEDFAAQVDYEVIYEAREFPLDLKRDLTIARDADFWDALRVLGETYRKSDGAFQILPTRFKQIVVVPMGQVTTAGQQ